MNIYILWPVTSNTFQKIFPIFVIQVCAILNLNKVLLLSVWLLIIINNAIPKLTILYRGWKFYASISEFLDTKRSTGTHDIVIFFYYHHHFHHNLISPIFRYCYAPFGIYLGIKNVKPKKLTPVPQLEKLYQSGKKMAEKEIKLTANQLQMTERQVERWLRVRKAVDRPTTLKKFCENSFRCTYYLYSFTYGLIVLWDKPWLWNINYCWYGYPHQVSKKHHNTDALSASFLLVQTVSSVIQGFFLLCSLVSVFC